MIDSQLGFIRKTLKLVGPRINGLALIRGSSVRAFDAFQSNVECHTRKIQNGAR